MKRRWIIGKEGIPVGHPTSKCNTSIITLPDFRTISQVIQIYKVTPALIIFLMTLSCMAIPARVEAFNFGKVLQDTVKSIEKQVTGKTQGQADEAEKKVEEVIDQNIGEPDQSPQQVQANKEVQQRLNALGYNTGTPDGVLGPRSISAIKAFQFDHGLPQTGQVSPELLAALRSADSPGQQEMIQPEATTSTGQPAAVAAGSNTTAPPMDALTAQQMNNNVKMYVHHVTLLAAIAEECQQDEARSRQMRVNFNGFVATYAPGYTDMAGKLYDKQYAATLQRMSPMYCNRIHVSTDTTLSPIISDEEEIIKLSGKPPGLAPSAHLPETSAAMTSSSSPLPPVQVQPQQNVASQSQEELPMNPRLKRALSELRNYAVIKAGVLEACRRGSRQEVRADLESFFHTHAPAHAGPVLDGPFGVFNQSFDDDVDDYAAAWDRENLCSDAGVKAVVSRNDSATEAWKEKVLQNLPPGASSLPAKPRPKVTAKPQPPAPPSGQQSEKAFTSQETQDSIICPGNKKDLPFPAIPWEKEREQVAYYCTHNYTLLQYDTDCCVEQFRKARLQEGPCADFYNVAFKMQYTQCGFKN